MPRFLPLATLAAITTTLLLMLGGGRLEALASDLDPLAEVAASEQREMISENEPRPDEHRGPQLEGSDSGETDTVSETLTPDELVELLEGAAAEVQITQKVIGHQKITGLVRAVGLPELLRRIRASDWQREAIARILERATLEMRLLRDVRNDEGVSWNELDLEIRLGRLDPQALARVRARLANFHATRIARSEQTFEHAARLIKQDTIERVSDLLDRDQDRQWRSVDKGWALRTLSFMPTTVLPTCCLGTIRRARQRQSIS